MATQNRTRLGGLGLRDRAVQILKTHRRGWGVAGAVAGGYVMACSYVFGAVSPFGVAFCATLRSPYAYAGALGAVLGYVFSPAPLANMKYLAAVVLVLGIKWLFGGKAGERFLTVENTLTALAALGTAGVALAVISDAALYDLLLTVAEVFLGAGAAYFFSRTLLSLEAGWGALARSDVSCMIVSFAVAGMGLCSITLGSLSLGRMLSVLVVLLCARAAGEAGGAVAGITAGLAVGLAGGDYSYSIAAYGFGGLMAGVFAGAGRIATTGAFIVVNAVVALFTKGTAEVYTALFEIFIATVIFAAVPQSVVSRFKLFQMERTLESETSAQGALRGRLSEIAGALRDISATTREVNHRLGKLEQGGYTGVCNRVADRVCVHCGRRAACWQLEYGDTMNALNSIFSVLKREGTVNRERMPKPFAERCCKLEDFVAELNIQFGSFVAQKGVQRKVSRVRDVVTGQFEGMAMMLEEISGELCCVTLLDAPKHRRVRDYFEREGFTPQQVRCYTNADGRIAVEVTIPGYEAAKLEGEQAAVDLSILLEAEFDRPCTGLHGTGATVTFTEKAVFAVEFGAFQIAPDGQKLCGDAYDSILNRFGRAHLILSDGMGSGGSAAVDSHMATGLLSRLITVGFSHEAALKMVNSALLIKSGDETLATVDICSVDLYTGKAAFYKAGAAPTFLLRSGRCGSVESTSLPAGILHGVAFDQSQLTLRESDVIVMVSDGVIATGSEWVKSELASMDTKDVQKLAERLAMTAKVRRTDGHQDDITVLAAALRRGM